MKNLYPHRLAGLLLAMSFFAQTLYSQVVINEYSCANLNQFIDDHSDFGDWLEVYNAGAATVDLSTYFLSDNENTPMKWPFPAGTTISANGFLVVWCSGRNISTPAGLHTNFKLSQTKSNPETLVLADAQGAIVSKIKINKTQVGMSRGRTSDGGATWGISTEPTAGTSNNGVTDFTNFADRPSFDLVPGYYFSAQTVTITNNAPGSTIYYTLDGSAPDATSLVYTNPVQITATTVLKAVAISDNPLVLPSFIEFSTYFMNVFHTLPIISVSGFELDVLANGEQSLRPVGSMEYFSKAGERTTRSYGEFNSHGQDSWVNDQRSMDLVCRDEMGYSKGLKGKLFERSERDEFQRLIMRAAGDDNYPNGSNTPGGGAHLRDAYVHNLADRAGLHLDMRRSEKAIVYVNGMYWGVYDLREIPDDHDYTEFYHNQGKYEIQYLLTWGNTWAEYGGDQALDDWSDLRAYINSHNMATQSYFNYVADRIDLTSLVDYVIVNSVTVCSDWLNYNTGWWRGFNPEGDRQKWSYILWDNDATFAYYINYTGIADTSATAEPCQVEALTQNWPDLNGHMRTLKKMRQNAEFDRYYKSRYIDLMNTVFSCDNMLSYLDTVYQKIKPEMPRHIQRWGGTEQEWEDNVAKLRDFISRRCVAMNEGIKDCYTLTGPYDVTFDADPSNIGGLQVNSLTINDLPYTGTYFGGIDIATIAKPDSALMNAQNLQFDRWTASGTATTFSLSDTLAATKLQITANDTITAHYITVTSSVSELPDAVLQPILTAAPTLFRTHTTVTLELPENQAVMLRLYAPTGREMAILATAQQPLVRGRHTFDLQVPEGLPAGMYILQLRTADGNVQVVKLIKQ